MELVSLLHIRGPGAFRPFSAISRSHATTQSSRLSHLKLSHADDVTLSDPSTTVPYDTTHSGPLQPSHKLTSSYIETLFNHLVLAHYH
jgi:hypothetical protein